MMGNYHVPFWRAVERATSSLTLIIRNEALRILALGTSATANGGVVSQPGKISVLLDAVPVEVGNHHF
jgi:hypothetical protein